MTSAVACGGGQSGPAAVSGPPALLDIVIPDAPLVIHVSVDGLRQSPYYTLVRDTLLAALSASEQEEANAILQLVDRIDHAVVSANPVREQFLLTLRGSFEPADLDRLNAPADTFTHRTHTLRGDDDARGLIVEQHTLMVGSVAEVTAALDRYDGLAPARGNQLGGFAEAAGRVHLGERDVSAVMMLTEEVRNNFGHGDVEDALRESGLSAGGSLDARNGIRVGGFFTASTEGAVQVLGAQLQGELSRAQQDTSLAMLGVAVLLQQIHIRQEGTDLLVEFQLDDRQVRDVLDRFGPLLQGILGTL